MTSFPANAEGLMAILRRLRAPDGCPWDRQQTRQSLIKSLSGEAAEVIDAIENNDVANLREELGDLLMNVLFQVVIAEENGEFTLEDVWREVNDKMVRRHAHIFGDAKAETAEEVVALWQKIKQQEHAKDGKAPSILEEVKPSLSALDRAEKLQKKAAKVGFDWSDPRDIVAKIKEETAEVEQALESGDEEQVDEELGDLFFAVSNLVRFRHRRNSEALLRDANRKFERRFRYIEAELARCHESLEQAGLARLEQLWNAAKKLE